MRVIEGTTIKINRGDYLPIKLKAKQPTFDENGDVVVDEHGNPVLIDYIFQDGETIQFGIYEKKKYDKNALLLKEVIVEEATSTVEFTITSQEMKIGKLINKPKDYWYEVTMDGGQTLIGYDENGAKILRLYPEGSEVI